MQSIGTHTQFFGLYSFFFYVFGQSILFYIQCSDHQAMAAPTQSKELMSVNCLPMTIYDNDYVLV